MSIEAWLEDLLPTKWARRLALATLALSAGAYALPTALPPSYLPSSQEQVFLIRIVLGLFTSLVGALVVLGFVVRAFHMQVQRHTAELAAANRDSAQAQIEPVEEKISGQHLQILKMLFESPRTLAEISVHTGVTQGEAKFYVSDLLERQMVHPPAAYSSGPEQWHIALEGQRMVMQGKVL